MYNKSFRKQDQDQSCNASISTSCTVGLVNYRSTVCGVKTRLGLGNSGLDFFFFMFKKLLQECSTLTIPEVQTAALGIFLPLLSHHTECALNGQWLMKAIRAHSCGCTADLATSHIAVSLPGQSGE